MLHKNNKKTVMETISVDITSDIRCVDLYLINIFTKSWKAERCTDVIFKPAFYFCLLLFKIEICNEDTNNLGTQYFILLNATSGTRWTHDTSQHLIFPAMTKAWYV